MCNAACSTWQLCVMACMSCGLLRTNFPRTQRLRLRLCLWRLWSYRRVPWNAQHILSICLSIYVYLPCELCLLVFGMLGARSWLRTGPFPGFGANAPQDVGGVSGRSRTSIDGSDLGSRFRPTRHFDDGRLSGNDVNQCQSCGMRVQSSAEPATSRLVFYISASTYPSIPGIWVEYGRIILIRKLAWSSFLAC